MKKSSVPSHAAPKAARSLDSGALRARVRRALAGCLALLAAAFAIVACGGAPEDGSADSGGDTPGLGAASSAVSQGAWCTYPNLDTLDPHCKLTIPWYCGNAGLRHVGAVFSGNANNNVTRAWRVDAISSTPNGTYISAGVYENTTFRTRVGSSVWRC